MNGPALNRRTLLAGAGGALAAGCLAPLAASAPASDGVTGQAQPQTAETAADEPVIWDVHGHLTVVEGSPEERIKALLPIAERMGIAKVVIFLGFSRDASPPPAQFRQDNDEVLRALDAAGDRALGFAYLNPHYVDESLAEMDRCIAQGPMVGVKLWIAMRCNHANLDPICRRAAELKVPVLQHTYWRSGPNLPGESYPADVAELGLRHPGLPIIAAHTGNDWERGIRAIRPAKNVYAETSGFDPTAGMVEMAVRELGAERVLYGSDFGGRSFASQLAKVVGADISQAQKRLILSGNIRRILQPILAMKGVKA